MRSEEERFGQLNPKADSMTDPSPITHHPSRISIIVAMAKNRVIGANNALPWRLLPDLKYFKALTMGHPIIMGRKTFESIGRALPGRMSVVVTRNTGLRPPGCITAHTIEDALARCKKDSEIFFIGGAEIYRQVLTYSDRLYVTEIQSDFAGDACFPEFDRNCWMEISRERHKLDDASGLEYHFVVYDRKPRS